MDALYRVLGALLLVTGGMLEECSLTTGAINRVHFLSAVNALVLR